MIRRSFDLTSSASASCNRDACTCRSLMLRSAAPAFLELGKHTLHQSCIASRSFAHHSRVLAGTQLGPHMSKLLEVKDFGPTGFKWLTLKRIYYQDPKGRKRVWESASRTTRKSDCDAVAIIAKVRSKTEPTKIILEAQYRPSQDAIVIEVPAGLIDEGEDAAKAAERELKEETGYAGTVTAVSEPCFSDPGMTDSNMRWAVVDVDADAPENAAVNPELEEGEFIEVFLVPFLGLHKTLVDLKKEKGWQLDARLLSYAWGLQHSQDWGIQAS